MEVYVNVPFFLIPLASTAVCAILALAVEAIARGNGGKVTYVFTYLVALVGAFLAIHGDELGRRTVGDLVLHGAVASILVMAAFISAMGSWMGKSAFAKLYAAHKTRSAPAWFKDDEEAAIRAIQAETDAYRLDRAAAEAKSYRVRSIANNKLGRHQMAQYEIALHSTDGVECLAALDEVEWDGWDYLLVKIATTSTNEAVALKAVGKMKDNDALAQAAIGAADNNVALKAVETITNDDALAKVVSKTSDAQVAVEAIAQIQSTSTLCDALGQMEYGETKASYIFEVGRSREDVELCVKTLDVLLGSNADDVAASLATIDGVFLKAVVVQWLQTAENPLEIAAKLKGKAIVTPAVAKSLEDYCCPDGHLHDLEDTSYIMHAGTDERYGVISCKRCGYEYTVDGLVQQRGDNCGYVFRPSNELAWLFADSKQIRCRPGGYRCASCKEFVQPTDDGPAPCICPTCGAQNHAWEHYDGEIVHRDYSSGTSYDYCKRCGKKDNIVDHNTW